MSAAPQIFVTYYTDPLCCWSWAMEPHWQRISARYRQTLAWRYRMGGMIPEWGSYSDPLNSIDRPAHMAPQWYHIAKETGAPIDERVWVEDPPGSSFPACVAVKTAALQGERFAEAYLRRARHAVMCERKNIARREVLLELSREITVGGFDVTRFERELGGAESLDAFRQDLSDTRYHGVGRFPTLLVEPTRGTPVLVIGFRPFEALREIIERAAPDIKPYPETEHPVPA